MYIPCEHKICTAKTPAHQSPGNKKQLTKHSVMRIWGNSMLTQMCNELIWITGTTNLQLPRGSCTEYLDYQLFLLSLMKFTARLAKAIYTDYSEMPKGVPSN